jgi:hypothetical protein
MRRRALLLRALASLFAFGWIVLPGFGAIDLSVTWDPEWAQVLEAGWGLYFTVIVGVPFVVTAVRPSASRPGVVQLAVATAVLAISALVALEIGALVLAAMLGLETAVVARLARHEWPSGRAADVSRLLGVLSAVGALPWLAYALDMWALNRRNLPDADITNSVDHYSVQGGVGLALAILPALAAVRPGLRQLVPACAGVVSAYLGLVSYAWPDAEGGFSRSWSVGAMAWGVALVALSLVDVARSRRAADPASRHR